MVGYSGALAQSKMYIQTRTRAPAWVDMDSVTGQHAAFTFRVSCDRELSP